MADIGSVISAVSTLLTGGSVSLGSVTLTGFEIPDEINFGGDQQLVVHKLPGGVRIINGMGDDPVSPRWSGTFTGPLAASRARQINALRLAEKPMQLTFGPFAAQVVIKSFHARYTRSGYWIPYTIECTVLPPTSNAPAGSGSALSGLIGQDAANAVQSVSTAASQVADVATTAVSQASAVLARITPLANIAGINLGGVTAALGTGSSIVADAANLATAPSAIAQSVTQFQSAISGIGSAASSVGSGINSIAATAAVAGAGDPAASIADMGNAAALTGAAASLAQAAASASRAAVTTASAASAQGS